jgi:hypothetical protein
MLIPPLTTGHPILHSTKYQRNLSNKNHGRYHYRQVASESQGSVNLRNNSISQLSNYPKSFLLPTNTIMKFIALITLVASLSTVCSAATATVKPHPALDALLAKAYSIMDLEGVCAKQACTSIFLHPPSLRTTMSNTSQAKLSTHANASFARTPRRSTNTAPNAEKCCVARTYRAHRAARTSR